MRGIVTVTYKNGKIETYEVNSSEDAISVWDCGLIQICADKNHIVMINKDDVIKVEGSPIK
ncbi:hypothetical protein [Listeria ilorinensis]|uniref:hypothetical protein n=1 Tax=Listeria ilorinensis TaxID=2867439 RepID=UPI001EF49C45|nr:hypothetical protein [Listeria ilorinensis]